MRIEERLKQYVAREEEAMKERIRSERTVDCPFLSVCGCTVFVSDTLFSSKKRYLL